MSTLLVLIYIAFISLGLPDAIMGAAWPAIRAGLGVNIAVVGIYSAIVSIGTVISSLSSEKMIRRFGTGTVTTFSVLLTAIGILGISFSGLFWAMCLFAVPLGIGAGAVDAALNNFVALHYKAKHMNWLHCFWGVGATAGPVIISFFLMTSSGWTQGYRVIAIIQFILVGCLLFSLKLWKKFDRKTENSNASDNKPIGLISALRLRGAISALLSFFCYCSVEATVGLWGASYLVAQNISASTAASWVGFYYFSITAGRVIAGFVSARVSNKTLIAVGQALSILGAVTLLIPGYPIVQMVGLILIGLGCAPIFPSMLHETPVRFGKDKSQSIMGIQMAAAYIGTTVMPPLFGIIADKFNISLLPVYILLLATSMFMLKSSDKL